MTKLKLESRIRVSSRLSLDDPLIQSWEILSEATLSRATN